MRTALAVVLLLLATAVAPGLVATRWVHDDVDDRDAFVDMVAPLAEDPDLREQLSAATAEALVTTLERRVGIRLPDDVDSLARATSDTVVESPRFPDFWRQAAADVHRQGFAVLDGDPDAPTSIRVDVGPLLAQALLLVAEKGIPVPESAATSLEVTVPVTDRGKVAEAIPAYERTQTLTTWLPVLWGGLVLLALLVARGWRGRVRVGGFALLGLALGAGIVTLVSGPAGDEVVSRAQLGQQGLARLLADRVVDSLGSYAGGWLLWSAVAGAVLVVASLIPGRRRSQPEQVYPQGYPPAHEQRY